MPSFSMPNFKLPEIKLPQKLVGDGGGVVDGFEHCRIRARRLPHKKMEVRMDFFLKFQWCTFT